jgi:two-component system, chemotaxis family, response regulator Rcp1
MTGTNPSGRPVEILLVDDDPEDVRLTQEGLRKAREPGHVTVVADGDEALAYLRGEGDYAAAILPDLILLDLKKPRRGGREVLEQIKADEALRHIPVIVLTRSDGPDDVLPASDLQANSCVAKPSDLDEFQRVMDSINDFCLTVVKVPPRG